MLFRNVEDPLESRLLLKKVISKRPLLSEHINIIVEQAEKLWTIIPSSFYATLKKYKKKHIWLSQACVSKEPQNSVDVFFPMKT